MVKKPTTDDKSIFQIVLDGVKQDDPAFADRHDKEDDQAFLKRLTKAMTSIDEKIWDAMPDASQAWVNGAIEAVNQRTEVEHPDGFEGSEPVPKQNGAADSGEETTTTRKKPAAAKKAAAAAPKTAPQKKEAAKKQAAPPKKEAAQKKAAAAAPAPQKKEAAKKAAPQKKEAAKKAAPQKKERAERAPTSVSTIRQFVIKKPNCTTEEIKAHLAAKNFETADGTIAATATFTKAVIRDAQAMGKWA